MEYLPCEMRSLFLWGEVHSIEAEPIYLGCAKCCNFMPFIVIAGQQKKAIDFCNLFGYIHNILIDLG
jgi:hypothetical protein